VASLNAGLQSGELAPLIAELGLDPSVAGPLGGDSFFFFFRNSFSTRL